MANSRSLSVGKRVPKMTLKYFLVDILHIGQPIKRTSPTPASKRVVMKKTAAHRTGRVVDLENIQASPKPSEQDAQRRIQAGRVAEMSLHNAGLN